MSTSPIHIIITGGTIDSHWDASKDTAVPNEQSILPRYFSQLKLYADVEFTEVCHKDSRDITEKDLKNIYEIVENSKHTRLIVTHGTYTMPDTARFLQGNLQRKDQVIILTGSMVPIDGFTFSDGPFNLGFAIGKLNELEPGVYVAMHGRIFTPNEVGKISSEGRFFSIFQQS